MGGLGRLQRLEAHLAHAQLREQRFHHALGIEEIELTRWLVPPFGVPGPRQDSGHQLAFLGLLVALGGEEHLACLIELHVHDTTALVVGHTAQQAGNYAATQDALLGRHGVYYLDGLATPLLAHAETREVAGIHQRVGHGLVDALRTQDLAHAVEGALLGVRPPMRPGVPGSVASTFSIPQRRRTSS